MKITDLLSEDSIALKVKANSKEEIIKKVVDMMDATGNIKDKAEYEKLVFAREKEGTTGIGEGIAIPHGKSRAVKKACLSAMVLPKGVEFEALDKKKVNLI